MKRIFCHFHGLYCHMGHQDMVYLNKLYLARLIEFVFLICITICITIRNVLVYMFNDRILGLFWRIYTNSELW